MRGSINVIPRLEAGRDADPRNRGDDTAAGEPDTEALATCRSLSTVIGKDAAEKKNNQSRSGNYCVAESLSYFHNSAVTALKWVRDLIHKDERMIFWDVLRGWGSRCLYLPTFSTGHTDATSSKGVCHAAR